MIKLKIKNIEIIRKTPKLENKIHHTKPRARILLVNMINRVKMD